MGVRRRRRFGFSAGALTSYEDEPLTAGSSAAVAAAESRILLEEIERPRVGPMRDIVATIQPDQDDLVRAALDQTVCVQGAPGTGKTAVGLHRAAYLLYTYPDRLRRSGVLVVGPNRAFLGYIGQVLPALGEIGVTQSTVDELLARVPVRAVDPAEVAALKGDARMAAVLRRAVARMVRRPDEGVVVVVGDPPLPDPARAAAPLRRRPAPRRGPLRRRAGAAAPAPRRGRPPAAGGGRRSAVGHRDRAGGPLARGARLRRRGVAGRSTPRPWSSTC